MGRFTKTLAKMRKGEQKGFTLIELLIVVAIIGILAAVIIPNVMTFMTTGRLNAARTEAENMKTAALAYFADHSSWPPPDGGNGVPAIVTGQYIQKSPIGTYSWNNSTGTMTGTLYLSFNWNPTTETWDK